MAVTPMLAVVCTGDKAGAVVSIVVELVPAAMSVFEALKLADVPAVAGYGLQPA